MAAASGDQDVSAIDAHLSAWLLQPCRGELRLQHTSSRKTACFEKSLSLLRWSPVPSPPHPFSPRDAFEAPSSAGLPVTMSAVVMRSRARPRDALSPVTTLRRRPRPRKPPRGVDDQSIARKSGYRFSAKAMRQQITRAECVIQKSPTPLQVENPDKQLFLTRSISKTRHPSASWDLKRHHRQRPTSGRIVPRTILEHAGHAQPDALSLG